MSDHRLSVLKCLFLGLLEKDLELGLELLKPKILEDVLVGLNAFVLSAFSLAMEWKSDIPYVMVRFSLKRRSYF